MPRDPRRRRALAREGHGRHERDRRRRDRDQERRDQVGVRERRRPAGAEPRREAVGDHVQALQRDGQCHALAKLEQPAAEAAVRAADRAARDQRRERDPEREQAVQREAPPERHDPVVDESERQDDACDRPEGEAERRPLVVVERGQRARDEAAVDLRDRGGNDPRQQLRRLVARVRVRRQRRGDPVRPDDREHHHRARAASASAAAQVPTSAPSRSSLRRVHEARQDEHAQRSCDEHEREVDAVRREEPVRLNAVPKLARENDTEHRGRAADRRSRDPRQKPAPNSPLTT